MGVINYVLANLCLNVTCPGDQDYGHQRVSRYFQLIEDLKNENLIIATLQNEQLSGMIQNGSRTIGTGIAFDLVNILQAKFGFNYTVVSPRSNAWGQDNGILSMLKNNEADLAAAFLPILNAYTDWMSYSPNLETGEWVVLMRRPKGSATGSGLLAPFTLPVWLLILVSLVIVGPIIYTIHYVQAKLCKDKEGCTVFPLPSCIWFVYGAILKQGTTLNPITDSSRLLFATWWIFITILTAFYTANLTAFLTLSKFTLPISEPKHIGSKRSKWVTTKGNALEDAISLQANIFSPFTLKSMLGLPVDYIDSNDTWILNEYVYRKNMMFIREKPVVEYIMYEDYKKKARSGIEEAQRCTYVITKFAVTFFPRAFAYAKNFKYKPLFDSAFQHLIEAGVIKFKLREDLPNTEICPLDLGQKERQLKNTDLLLTYMIVGGGFAFAGLIFILENLLKAILFRKKDGDVVIKPMWSNKTTLKHGGGDDDDKLDLNDDQLLFNSKFVTPPPPYHSIFKPPHYDQNVKRRKINGRDYWVYDSGGGQTRLVPLRAPSAMLFQFTN